MPSLWSCGFGNCQLPAVQRAGDCLLCDKHLCRLHLQDEWHKCPKPEVNWSDYSAQYAAEESRRLDELCQRIDGRELCARASQLRSDQNVPCTVDLSRKALSARMGGQNCHAEIVFADGVVWLARFRLSSAISPPQEVRDYVLQSEAATLKFLQSHTKIPSPRIFDWACESAPENPVGVGYIIMEKLRGTPLDWQAAGALQREKVVRQLADIMLEIEKHSFDQLGSLVHTHTPSILERETTWGAAAGESQIQVCGLAEHSTFKSGEGGRPLGPFRSSREAFNAYVEAYLGMIAVGEIGTAENAVDVFLDHRFRLDVADGVWGQTAAKHGEKFFLKHADDKGDHILVSADFDIVGIIDWEWCSTASREEAFSSPCMMWPVGAFYDGSNELAEEELLLARVYRERGRDDFARCVLDGRKVQRLLFALGPGGALADRKTRAGLFTGLRRAFDGHGGSSEEARGAEDVEWAAWKASALAEWKDDRLLQAVLNKK